jgi:lipopolysaccharide assembly protein A
MKIVKIIVILALFILALALGAQNQELVTFNYLLAQGSFHLSWLLGTVFAIGFLIAWLIFGSLHIKAKFTIRKLNKQLKNQAENVQSTRDVVKPSQGEVNIG